MTMSIPFPLETLCFQKLVRDLETFPTESLALLPLHLRRKLACNLPAVDVCQLEQTSFTEGVDMKDIWAGLCEKHGIKTRYNVRFPSGSDDSKDLYLSYLSKQVLNHFAGDQIILNHLFSAGIKPAGAEDGPIVPLRHAQHFKSYDTDSELVELILKTTNYHPKTLHVFCGFTSSAMHSELWQNTDRVLLQTYLSHTASLTLMFWYPTFALDFSFLFSVLENKHRLKQLTIVDCGHDNSNIEAIGQFLNEITSLNEIELGFDVSDETESDMSERASLELSRIINAQSSLHKCSLKDAGFTVGPPLGSVLANLLQQPQFCELNLGNVCISFSDLQHIFSTFVMASSMILKVLNITVTGGHDTITATTDLPQCTRGGTELTNELTLYMNDLPDSFLVWLSRIPLHLKRLELFSYRGVRVLPFVSEHPALIVEELHLDGNCIGVTKCFRKMQDLKQLTLCFYDMYRNARFLPDLARAISQSHSLELLKFRPSSALDCYIPDITQMASLFHAILSLPQLERFTLVLDQRDFDKCDLELLHELWKQKCGGRKFKRIIYRTRSPCSFHDMASEWTTLLMK